MIRPAAVASSNFSEISNKNSPDSIKLEANPAAAAQNEGKNSSPRSIEAAWANYPWQVRHQQLTPKQRNLPTADGYVLNSIDPGLIYWMYWVIQPNDKDTDSDTLDRFLIFERELWFIDNLRTTGLLFISTSLLFFLISYYIVEIPNWLLIVFILIPPFYVFIRIIIQRLLTDGTVLKTIKVLNSELNQPIQHLNEVLEIQENLQFHTSILLTIFTNASILVGTVTSREILWTAIFLSHIFSFLVFFNFFKERIYSQSRSMLRLKQYWDQFTNLYDTEEMQRKITRQDKIVTKTQQVTEFWCCCWTNFVAFRGTKSGRWNPKRGAPRLTAWTAERLAQIKMEKKLEEEQEKLEDKENDTEMALMV